MEAARPYVKLSLRITNLKQIPFLVEKAVRHALSGRPGPVYIDAPDNILQAVEELSAINFLPKFENVVKFVAP